jgi:hypothetical protein
MHYGRIVWYGKAKEQGVIEAHDGQRYFLLHSHIIKAPDEIKSGHFVKFISFDPARKPSLLPTACAVTISEIPLEKIAPKTLAVISGADQKGGQEGGQ